MPKLREKKLKNTKSITGKAVGFKVDAVQLPNGKKATREYLDHPGAVAVIPFLDAKTIIMVRQFRYPVNQITWEIPAGKLSKRENILACAKRELKEETGYAGKKYKKLLSMWPTPAFANEVIYIYTAKGLKPGKANPDEDEFIHAKAFPFKQAIRMIYSGKIKDAKTIIGLLAVSTKKI